MLTAQKKDILDMEKKMQMEYVVEKLSEWILVA